MKNGNPFWRLPKMQDVAQVNRHACPTMPNLNLRASCRACFFLSNSRGRMRRRPLCRAPRTDMNHIRNGIPLAVELADLLLIYVERQRDLMIALARLGVHGRN